MKVVTSAPVLATPFIRLLLRSTLAYAAARRYSWCSPNQRREGNHAHLLDWAHSSAAKSMKQLFDVGTSVVPQIEKQSM
jgi:hypothetical protein